MSKILNEEGLAYLWLKITSIFAKQKYSTTSHNHDGRYALADHSHEAATSFGTLEIASNTINLCPYVGPTYTMYDVRESQVLVNVTSAGANPVWHKIMLRNRTEAQANFIFRAIDTDASAGFECIIDVNGVVEATLVRIGNALLVTFSEVGKAI